MRKFSSFIVKKDRENKEHLHTLQSILEKAGFQVANHLDDQKEPYLYIYKPVDIDPIMEQLSFGGVRLYTRGKDLVCYRAQNKEKTEPFGEAQELDVKTMFKDLVKDFDKEKIGYRIIFYVIKELKEYFIQSALAEKEQDTGGEDSQFGSAVIGSMGTDYSNQVTNNNRG